MIWSLSHRSTSNSKLELIDDSVPMNEDDDHSVNSIKRGRSWKETLRERVSTTTTKRGDHDEEDVVKEDLIPDFDATNTIKVVSRRKIREMATKYDLEYFECFGSEHHINETMHRILFERARAVF